MVLFTKSSILRVWVGSEYNSVLEIKGEITYKTLDSSNHRNDYIWKKVSNFGNVFSQNILLWCYGKPNNINNLLIGYQWFS